MSIRLLARASTEKSFGYKRRFDAFTFSHVSAPSFERYRPTPSLIRGAPGPERFAQIIANSVPPPRRSTRQTRMFCGAPKPLFFGAHVLPSSVDLKTPSLNTPA